MAYMPAGAELDDEDLDDLYDDDYDDHNRHYVDNSFIVNDSTPKQTPKQKPKRNVCLESIASSDGPIVLDDIRLAVINGDFEYLRQLIEKDNNFFVDTVLTAGWTPLMYAASNGHNHIVHYLLERGADPNFHNDNSTALMSVCGARSDISEADLIECVKHLIHFGANVNALDKYGNTALIYAAKAGKCGLIEYLIDHKADVNRPNNDGWNALHWAVREGHGRVIEKLLNSNDIDLTLKTKSLLRADQIAESNGHHQIKTILTNIMKNVSHITDGNENNSNILNKGLSDEDVKALETYIKPKVEKKPTIDNDELESFLRHSNASELLPRFLEHNICYQDLVTSAEAALIKIGVKEPALIRKICANIVLLHNQDWKKESLKEIDLKTHLTCPELLCIVSNVANHLHRIDQTVVFLNKVLKQRPEIVSLNNEMATKRQVSNEILQSLSSTRMLFEDFQSLRNVINSIEDFSEPQTPQVLSIPFTLEDELNNKSQKSTNYSKSLLVSVIAVSALTVWAIKVGQMGRQNTITFILNSFPSLKIFKL